MPKVSVVIPTYNRANFLPRTIKSVLNQTFQDFELIIVDDCSTDNTQEVVKEFQKKDDRIRYIRLDKNSGAPAHPKNIGIQNAKGEFIAFLDSDDEWLPDKIEKQLELFKKNSRLGFVSCNAFIVDEGQNKKVEYKIPKSNNYFLSLLETDIICSCSSVMVKKNVLDDVSYFDENFKVSDDWDMWLRISEKYDFDFVPKPLFEYYIHGGNVTQTLSVDERIKDLKYILKKYKNSYRRYPKAYSIQLRDISHKYLLSGRKEKSRIYSKKSIRCNIFNFKGYLDLSSSFINFSFYKKLLKLKRKLFKQSTKI